MRHARLARGFYSRPAPEVARDLLGKILVRTDGDERLTARVVEAEAYGEEDPASHSFRGRTQRNRSMFEEPGVLYVYFTYGMHFCMNVVTGSDGEGSAVLIRAAEPMTGLEIMAERRGIDDPRKLCSGPARLCQAFGISRPQDGTDLVNSTDVWLEEGPAVPDELVAVTSRVGISRGTELAWRFVVAGDPYASRPSPTLSRS